MMRRKTTLAILIIAAFLLSTFGNAAAATSPNGPGQPGAPATTCGGTTSTGLQIGNGPSGFNTQAFLTATTLYAGSPGTPSLANANSPNAISQYDIACFQQTLNH